jgi:ABC-type transporter Mla subunit MlaD
LKNIEDEFKSSFTKIEDELNSKLQSINQALEDINKQLEAQLIKNRQDMAESLAELKEQIE